MGEKVPWPHAWHWDATVAPVLLVLEPAAHGVQDVAPAAAHWPSGQGVQEVDAGDA